MGAELALILGVDLEDCRLLKTEKSMRKREKLEKRGESGKILDSLEGGNPEFGMSACISAFAGITGLRAASSMTMHFFFEMGLHRFEGVASGEVDDAHVVVESVWAGLHADDTEAVVEQVFAVAA